MIVEEVVAFEAVYKLAKLLDELCEGLKHFRVLRTMRTFPNLFVHLFTYTASVTSADVLGAICVPQGADESVTEFMTSFINDLDENGMCYYFYAL